MKIKKGDTVKVLYGKDAGKTGKVLRVLASEYKLIVDGINVFKKHVKGDGQKKQSEIVDIVKPMSVSKVILVCPNCNKPTRVAFKLEDKKKMRVCKKCGKAIDQKPEKVENKSTATKKTAVAKSKKSNKAGDKTKKVSKAKKVVKSKK